MKVTFKHKITEERLRDYITRDCEDWDHKEMNHYKNTPLADQLKELEIKKYEKTNYLNYVPKKLG